MFGCIHVCVCCVYAIVHVCMHILCLHSMHLWIHVSVCAYVHMSLSLCVGVHVFPPHLHMQNAILCMAPFIPWPSCWIRGIEEGSHLTGRDKFHKMHEVLTCTHYHSVAEPVFLVLQVSNTCVVCCSCVSVCCALHSPILQLHSPTHLSLSAVLTVNWSLINQHPQTSYYNLLQYTHQPTNHQYILYTVNVKISRWKYFQYIRGHHYTAKILSTNCPPCYISTPAFGDRFTVDLF